MIQQKLNAIRLILITLLSSISIVANAQNSNIDWRGDIKFLAAELPKRHVDFFFQLKQAEFERQAKALIASLAGNPSDAEVTIGIMKLVAMAKDGHTSVAPDFSKLHFYPINFRWFDDGIHVVNAGAEFKDVIGSKLVSFGDLEVSQAVSKLKRIIPHDNQQGLRRSIEMQLNTAELLQYLEASKNSETISMDFEKDGKSIQKTMKSIQQKNVRRIKWSFRIKKPPLYMQKSNLDFWNDWIADQKTLYFKYNRCRNPQGFAKLVAGTSGFIEQNDVQKFVLDLRNNSGGNSAVFAPLLKYLQSQPELNRKGKLFAIIGRQTFSSGLWNAIELKQKTNVILVGEPTGGRPNHFGEIKVLQLPSSKLKVYYSTRRWTLMKNADPESFEPDIRVKLNSADFLDGKDPYLKAIFDYRDK